MERPDRSPPDGPETDALARGAREGDDFGPLFVRVAPALYAWAALRVRGSLQARLDPEDLVQEIAIRALRGIRNFDPSRGEFRGWIFGVANNVLKQALLRLSRAAAGTGEDAEDERDRLAELPDDATSVSRRVARDEAIRAFIDRAAGLQQEDRMVLIYRGLMGMTHVEVAERLHSTVDAAEKRWQRLRGRLGDVPPGLLLVE